MDMKKILQSLDGVAAKPVEGVDSMAKFLRVVKEADLNQPTAPVAPTAPAQPQVNPAKYQVPSVDFFKKNYKHPADVIDGAYRSETDPSRIGGWQGDSDFADLMLGLNASYYRARQADPNFKQPAFVKDDWELVQRMLGTLEGKEYAIDQSIGLSNIDDKSPDAEFNRAQHKEFEKQANARFMQQPDGVVTPGWKYDQKLGMTPAQAELQKQKAQQQPATVQENMDKFLSIMDKNNVDILKEGRGPLNRLTQAESIAVYHSEPVVTRETITSPVLNVAVGAKPSMIGKYFKTVEQEFAESADRTKNRARRLAERIIERVTIGPDGKVTGGFKPNLSEPVPSAEPASAPSNVKPSGSTVEYGGSTYSVNVFGDGMRPRIGRSDKVVTAKVYTLGDKMYVLLDPAAQEGVAEGSGDKKPYPNTWHDVDPKLGKQVDKMSPEEKVKKGYSNPSILKKKKEQGVAEDKDPCWDSHKMVGTKKKGGKTVPNCVPK